MKNKLVRLLAATGIIVVNSVNAAAPTITDGDIQAYGVMIAAFKNSYSGAQLKDWTQGAVNLLGSTADKQSAQSALNSLTSTDLNRTYNLTPAQIAQVDSVWNAAISSSNLTPVLSVVNKTLQSTAACSTMGTYPSTISSSSGPSIKSCATALENALITAGLTSDAAKVAGALSLLKAVGIPANIFGASPVTVSQVVVPQIQRSTSIQQASIISNVVSNIFSMRGRDYSGAQMRVSLGEEKGMAAGNSPSKLNAWLNGSNTKIGNTSSLNNFDGDVTNALGGIDYMFTPKFVAGVSLGYDQTSIDYRFSLNSGLTSAGWMVAPYASYQISDLVSVDGAYGYASGNIDNKISGIVTTQGYTRNFFALNLTSNYWLGDWQLTGKANYISAEEKNIVTNKMDQFRLSGQIGYWKNGMMPYANLAYVKDLNVSTLSGTPASNDTDAWVAGIGLNLFSKGAIFGGVLYNHEFARADSKNDTFMANIGYRL